jgi:PmbA protein
MTVLVENRVAGRLLGFLVASASAPALQQKRSFLEGKIGAKVASEKLTVFDDPLIPGALGSRAFDSEGLAAKRLPFLDAGVLRSYFVDWYYGRKLGLDPTTAGPSNLVVAPGARPLADLEKSADRAILVTSFLGGNSNGLTGDFSVGIQGVLIEKGARTQPIVEMNLAGNHKDFWTRLVEVGSDTWTYGGTRSPSLVFEGVSVAGA